MYEAANAFSYEEDCIKYSGRWISVRSTGLGRSDIGSLLSKDLPATGGLLLLIGASPALGFLCSNVLWEPVDRALRKRQ